MTPPLFVCLFSLMPADATIYRHAIRHARVFDGCLLLAGYARRYDLRHAGYIRALMRARRASRWQ